MNGTYCPYIPKPIMGFYFRLLLGTPLIGDLHALKVQFNQKSIISWRN